MKLKTALKKAGPSGMVKSEKTSFYQQTPESLFNWLLESQADFGGPHELLDLWLSAKDWKVDNSTPIVISLEEMED